MNIFPQQFKNRELTESWNMIVYVKSTNFATSWIVYEGWFTSPQCWAATLSLQENYRCKRKTGGLASRVTNSGDRVFIFRSIRPTINVRLFPPYSCTLSKPDAVGCSLVIYTTIFLWYRIWKRGSYLGRVCKTPCFLSLAVNHSNVFDKQWIGMDRRWIILGLLPYMKECKLRPFLSKTVGHCNIYFNVFYNG